MRGNKTSLIITRKDAPLLEELTWSRQNWLSQV
jgi:hypothetical protein